MFEFVTSQNQKWHVLNRVLTRFSIGCMAHVLLIAALIRYPELLQGGMLHRFRTISLITDSLTIRSDIDEKKWRTVIVLKPQSAMQAPSMATLRQLVYDWNKKGAGNNPPIRIRWGDEQKAALNEKSSPSAVIKPEAKLSFPPIPANETTGGMAASVSEAASSKEGTGDDSPGAYVSVKSEEASGKKVTINLPSPGSSSRSEGASNNAPKSIPEGVKLDSPPSLAETSFKVFENEQKAITSAASGFFDTKGFPLGEYANLIKERIKGKWMIPSNLQSFQGHTTVVFYIDRNGRYANARIVTSSGSNSFDIAALMAVIESDPFPPLPKGFPGNQIGAKFVLSWNEP